MMLRIAASTAPLPGGGTVTRVRLEARRSTWTRRVWRILGGYDEGHLERLLPLHPVASQVLLGDAASEVCQVTNLWPCKEH